MSAGPFPLFDVQWDHQVHYPARGDRSDAGLKFVFDEYGAGTLLDPSDIANTEILDAPLVGYAPLVGEQCWIGLQFLDDSSGKRLVALQQGSGSVFAEALALILVRGQFPGVFLRSH